MGFKKKKEEVKKVYTRVECGFEHDKFEVDKPCEVWLYAHQMHLGKPSKTVIWNNGVGSVNWQCKANTERGIKNLEEKFGTRFFDFEVEHRVLKDKNFGDESF